MARARLFPDSTDVKVTAKISGRRGNLIWRPYRGLLVVQRTPTYTAKRSLDALQRWIAWLRVQNVLFLYCNARVRNEFLRQERLSGVPARDWFMSQSRGLTWVFSIPGLGEVYSMSHVERFSRSLDVFGQSAGDILVRGEDVWGVVSAGLDGQVLTVKNGRVVWGDIGGGSGGFTPYSADSMYAFSTTIVTRYSHLRAVRLPYLTEGAADLFIPFYPRRFSSVRVWYEAPVGSTGYALLYVKSWATVQGGAPTPLPRVDNLHYVASNTGEYFSVSFQLPAAPESATGLVLSVGREGQNSADTFPDYVYLLSVLPEV